MDSAPGLRSGTSEFVPSATIARIFHSVAFQSETTKITAPAVILTSEYIRLFVQEAVLRANEHRLSELANESVKKEDPSVDDNKQLDNEDEEDEEEHRGLGLMSQLETEMPVLDALEARHLMAVSGLLLMDF